MKECICIICKREYIYKRHSGTMKKCNSCLVNLRRILIKDKCLQYKGNKCSKCGYNKCKQALTFHHRNPKKKLFGISGSHARSWEHIKQELDKCDLLCMNCHMEIEYSNRLS